jgi:peptidyl-tRNA hydrolase
LRPHRGSSHTGAADPRAQGAGSGDDPLRMVLVVRRGAFTSLAPAGVAVGAAAVACVARFEGTEEWGGAVAAWRARPGKVVLRARSAGQWSAALSEPGGVDGSGVVALAPRRRSERGAFLDALQAMTTALEPPPEGAEPAPGLLTYLLNPRVEMSSGKTLAQIAHAAVMAAEQPGLEPWAQAGCPARVLRAPAPAFEALCAAEGLAARVVDAGLTEVEPGTVTVLGLAPAADAPPASRPAPPGAATRAP